MEVILVNCKLRAASRASTIALVFSSIGFTYVGNICVLAWPNR